jgi:hypothetical protein
MITIHVEYNQGQFRKLRDKLDGFERKQVYHQSVGDVAKFMIGKFQVYPPYRYVSRRQAYGVTFFTDRQRRWFFAALRSGELQIPYARTQRLRYGWRSTTYAPGQIRIVNDVPYTRYVQSKPEQSRMMRLIGWDTAEDTMDRYEGEIGRVAFRRVDQWAKE